MICKVRNTGKANTDDPFLKWLFEQEWVNDPILGEYRRLIVIIVSSLIPMIAMTVFGIALVYDVTRAIGDTLTK
jgi:hypothetical protein